MIAFAHTHTHQLEDNSLQTAINDVIRIFDDVSDAALEDTSPTGAPVDLCCDEGTAR